MAWGTPKNGESRVVGFPAFLAAHRAAHGGQTWKRRPLHVLAGPASA
jgi:hypothetical protein